VAAAVSNFDSDELRREAIARVPGCENGQPPVAVAPLHGGTSNATFCVQTRLGLFVLRLNEPESLILGIDRHREAVLHSAAAQAGLAPAIVHADTRGRFLITEYIAGETWSPRDMGDWTCLARLATALCELHALQAPAVANTAAASSARPALSVAPSMASAMQAVSAYSLPALLEHHAQRACEANPGEAAQLEMWVHRAKTSLKSLGARQPAIIHNDVFHANLIGSGQRLYLVDWEYAAVSDPLYDLGCLLAYYPQAESHARRLLTQTGLAPRASQEELGEITWIYVLLSYLWYLTRGQLAPASSQDREAERALRLRLKTR
jgi:thiamine kinase